MLIVHPACGKSFPANNTHGHCSRCHETFVGLSAFEAHWVTDFDGDRICVHPSTLKGEWWQDASGFWHKGRKLTSEERNKIWKGGLDDHDSEGQ